MFSRYTWILLLASFGFATKQGQRSSQYISNGYFTEWHAKYYPISAIPWDRYTSIKYAFVEPDADGSLSITPSSSGLLSDLVTAGQSHNVKIIFAAGGWTGSRFFSTIFSTPSNRTAFVKTCVDFVQKYKLSGVHFDYEYPNHPGIGCNAHSGADTANFLSFLQELRRNKYAAKWEISATGSVMPWLDESGAPSKDLSGFVQVLDYVSIMNYDIYGRWADTAGPNAPLGGSSCDKRNTQGSAEDGLAAWLAAGFPAKKIVLGVPAYGHGFAVNQTAAFEPDGSLNMYPAYDKTNLFQGGAWDDGGGQKNICGDVEPYGGTYTFWALIDAGFLDQRGQPATGIVRGYDQCSKTAAVYNLSTGIWVSYDDAQTFADKAAFIKQHHLAGFAMWETAGDKGTILIDSINSKLKQ